MYQSVKMKITWSYIFDLIGYILRGYTHIRHTKIDWENPDTGSYTDLIGVEQYY